MRRTVMVTTMVVALAFSMIGGATASHLQLPPSESDLAGWSNIDDGFQNWSMVDGVLTAQIEQETGPAPSTGRQGMGGPTFDEPVDQISVDLYLDPAWETGNVAVAAQFQGRSTTAGENSTTWPMIEFARLDGFEGFRYWSSVTEGGGPRRWVARNTLDELGVDYGEWVTLTITSNDDTEHFEYAINGTPVGIGSSFGLGDGGLVRGKVLVENFHLGQTWVASYDIDERNAVDYTLQWRGLDEGRLFDPADAQESDSLTVDVTYAPVLDVSIEVDGDLNLPVDEVGEYTATVRNHGTGRDQPLQDWYLGLEVSAVTSLNEVTLEFCESDVHIDTHEMTITDCFDVDLIDGVETQLVGDTIQVRGLGEDTIQPGYATTFPFRASFRNEGQFTGTVYVFTD